MIIFIQKRDRIYRKIIYNKKKFGPQFEAPQAAEIGPVWGTKWLGQEVYKLLWVHDMKKRLKLRSINGGINSINEAITTRQPKNKRTSYNT